MSASSDMIRRRLAPLAILLAVAGFHLGGLLAPLERAVGDLRFRLLERPATGELVFVQIDARSLEALGVWPWPRDLHARLLDQLFAAGVREVAFDVDLSSASDPAADARFAAALARHGTQVILPAFQQLASPGSGSTDLLSSRPLPALREGAQLGTVNVHPDPDGLVRRIDTEQRLDGRAAPSMFVLLAGPAHLDAGRFRIDYGIDPANLPRLSYVDVLNGAVAPDRLAGRRVIVGASAAELGDQLAVPVHQVLPGAVVQALAYESLVQGRALHDGSPPLVLLVGALLALFLLPAFDRLPWRAAAALAVLAVLAIEGGGLAVQAAAPVTLATPTWSLLVVLGFLYKAGSDLRLQDLQLLRQRLTMARRRAIMDSVVHNSFDGIAITDASGRIEAFNDAAAQILGCRTADALGHALPELLPPVAAAMRAVEAAPSACEDETAVSHVGPEEHEIAGPDGEAIVIELVVSRILPRQAGRPGPLGLPDAVYSFTFRNVTERRRAQEAQRAAAEQAEAASRTKSEFLANMSHELRTPLNAIIGFSDMMKAEAFGPVGSPQYREYVEDINRSGQHLLAIISDILDVSRVELGKIKLNVESVSLKSIVESCCVLLAGWPAGREHELAIDIASDLPPVEADPRLLKQVLLNLLSNAVKYSPRGSTVTLRLYLGADGGPVIEVEDQGVGIAAEDIPKLTTPFYQTDGSMARKHEGTGLGLCLVAAYAELHGGRLEIESEPGEGTKVTVHLPAACVVSNSDFAGSDRPAGETPKLRAVG